MNAAARLPTLQALPGPDIDPSPAPEEMPASPSPDIPWPPQPAESPALPPAEVPTPAPPEMPGSPPVHTPSLPSQTPAPATAVGAWALVGAGLLAFACLAGLTPAAQAQTAPTAGVGAADRRFLAEATSSGMVEIVLGRLAVEKAVGEPVRRLGRQMVDDHVASNEAMKALAAAKSVPLPTGLSADEKANAGRFKKLKGSAFDRNYLAKMVTDHQKAVALFAQASSAAVDADVKAFAQTTLPTMRSHLETTKQLSSAAVAPPKRGTAARE